MVVMLAATLSGCRLAKKDEDGTVKKTLYTGRVGDGKIFVYNVQKVIKVRTGEEDLDALKDVE